MMLLRDVPYWLDDRDSATYQHLLDNPVSLGWTATREHTYPFDDALTFMMVPVYMRIGARAFPPVIMAPPSLAGGRLPADDLLAWLTGAHRLRAAYFAGISEIPAYVVVDTRCSIG